ncbi:MAG: CoA protein activase [Chloroflexi bacterium]|nr:CoA protein activase [Chloroflexota bacterium]
MRIGIPHMGNVWVTVKALLKGLDVECVVPPMSTRRTLSLGVRYSPEGLCLPFKLTLGNLIEAAEMGADVLLMPGGSGICRLGYYGNIQQQILDEMGFKVEVKAIGVSDRKLFGVLALIRSLPNKPSWSAILSSYRFGMAKQNSLDRIEMQVQKVRPVEQTKGTANRIYDKAIKAVDAADDYDALKSAEAEHAVQLNQVPRNGRKPLLVGITGEFYVLLEPFSNLDVEDELGKLGVEVRRTTFISKWTRFSLFLNAMGLNEKQRIHRAAMPYLKRDIGGDGWESVGEKVLHSREYDGIVHLAPFTCMPEIVAQNIMPSTKEKIPVLTLLCDEQMGKPGMLTRLEAFVDLLERRRKIPSSQ